MRFTVYPEPLRTAKDKLHPPRLRIADEPIVNVLCRLLLLSSGTLAQRLYADIIFEYHGSKNGVPV